MVKPLIITDTETTGLNNGVHRIIQIYSKVSGTDKHINIVMSPADKDGEFTANWHALAVNGIDIVELCKNGMTQREGIVEYIRWLDEHAGPKALLLAHNAPFDKGFIEAWFNRENRDLKKIIDYHWADTITLAVALRQQGLIDPENLKLDTLCKYFGFEIENAHDAGGDVEATDRLYLEMCKLIPNPSKPLFAE